MVSWNSTRICLAIWLLTGQPAGVAEEPAESPVDVPAAVDPGRQELPQVARINAAIRHSWRANQLEPSAPASDSEFLRRLYLDVLGRIPTVDELANDLADKRPDRKQRWVQRLIYEDLYAVDFANHWATIWANLLVGVYDDVSLTHLYRFHDYVAIGQAGQLLQGQRLVIVAE